MKKVLATLFLLTLGLQADPGNAYLSPQGTWPICEVSPGFPSCYAGMPHLYILIVSPLQGSIGFDWHLVSGERELSGYQAASAGWFVPSIPEAFLGATVTITQHVQGATVKTEARQ